MTLAIVFLFPALLAAAGLAAAPIIIHFILKTKARHVIFPALQFVKKTHQANISRLKLRHLILLAMRMLAIVLLVVLLARAQVPSWQVVADRSAPAAAVIVIDDSGSMNYRRQGQPLLSWARQQAAVALQSLPAGSRAAVIGSSGRGEETMLEPSQSLQTLAQWPATFGRHSLAAAVARATGVVKQSELARKEVYIFTDMTANAWRDGGGVSASADTAGGVQYNIVNLGGEDLNVGLGDLRLSAQAVPAGCEVKIETTVSSAHVTQDATVVVELAGQTAWQQSVHVTGGSSVAVWAAVTPTTPGLVHGRVMLKNPDPLEMDNVRYFTLHVDASARMLMVVGPTNIGRTGFIMGAAVAPSGIEGEGGIVRTTISADALDANALAGVRVVMLADTVALSDTQWRQLLPVVQAGGSLWIVAGPAMQGESYNTEPAQRLMPAVLGAVEELSEPVALAPRNLSHPMLSPFADGQNPSLSEGVCSRRFAIASLANDSQSVMDFADNVPAVLVRRVGEGSVVMWNFSPLRTLSNLASLSQLPILAARTVQVLAADPGGVTSHPYGQAVSIPIPQALNEPTVSVKSPLEAAERPMLPDPRRRSVNLTAKDLGAWDVHMVEGSRKIDRGFSVNAEAAESDLAFAETPRVVGLFPPDSAAVAATVDELTYSRRMTQQPLDLAIPILLALLALVVGESFFANRFYKHTVATDSTK